MRHAGRYAVLIPLMILVWTGAGTGMGALVADELLLRNARLVDPATETIRGADLLIRDGRIAAVLESSPDGSPSPSGFSGRVVDLGEAFVIPGLHDLHVHAFGNLSPVGLPELLGAGIVAERMLYAGVVGFLDLANFEDEILELRRSTRESSMMADLYAAGAIVTCPGGHGTEYPNPAREVTSPETARASVAELAAKRPDVVKLVYIPSSSRFPSIDRETMVAVIDEAHRHGIRTVAHVDHWPDALEVVEAGVDALTHTHHEPPPSELIEAMLDRGTAIIPTLAVETELARIADRPAVLEDPLLVALSHPDLRALYGSEGDYLPRLGEWMELQRERRDGNLAAVGRFAASGVPVLSGTDSGNPGTFQGFSLHRELELLVEAGLSEWEALRGATVTAGAFLGRSVGFEAGDRADLVVLEASPIEDIRNTRRIRRVIHQGVEVDRAALLGTPDLFDVAPDLSETAPVAAREVSGDRERAESPESASSDGAATFSEAITVTTATPSKPLEVPALDVGWLDVLTTAGTNGDVLYATQQLPGVVKIDEGAGLFVRGGDVAETATFLDRSLLAHPYRFETPTGGLFGTVGTMELRGVSLASGGFSARYGNALSAVLELEPLGRPELTRHSATLGLGALGVEIARPLGDQAGVRLGGSLVDTSALIGLNGREEDFASPPVSTGAHLSFSVDNERVGGISVSGFSQSSEVEPRLEEGSFDGFLESSSDNSMLAIGWDRALSASWRASLRLAASEYGSTLNAGVLEMELDDRTRHARFDLRRDHGRWGLGMGAEWERTDHRSLGVIPEVGGDFEGVQGSILWSSELRFERLGSYVEVERRLGPLVIDLGLRAERFDRPSGESLEPRLAVGYRLSDRQSVRLAAGIYRQAPALTYLDPSFGNPDLELMEAEHLVAGYFLGDEGDRLHLRVEAYLKRYDQLPLEDGTAGFSSEGQGSARGLDLLLRLDRRPVWDGWISYSYLEAERLYTPWQDRGRFPEPDAPFAPDFAVPHTLQVVGRVALPASLDFAASARVASGRPYTPVLGSEETGQGVVPVYGEINSSRLPHYARLDVSLSRPFAVLGNGLAVAFLGINDLLDRGNVFRYVYNHDYSQRRPARDSTGRALYFGVSVTR